MKTELTRRDMLGSFAVAAAPAAAAGAPQAEQGPPSVATPLNVEAGVDRVVMVNGKTYLRGWAGYGQRPRPRDPWQKQPAEPPPAGPETIFEWSKASGTGEVVFDNPRQLVTTARFSKPGAYTLQLTANDGKTKASASTVQVTVEQPPPVRQLGAVYTRRFRVDSRFWGPRVKALVVNWIPHCIDVINRDDVTLGEGGIDNFVEAGKKLRGEPAVGLHKGYVFSNAWVHQTVEAMSIALMIDPQGDRGDPAGARKVPRHAG